jgi:hypothetical protein
METYNNKILPAYRRLTDENNPEMLVCLIKELLYEPRQIDSLIGSKEFYNEAIGILTGDIYYNPFASGKNNGNDRRTTHKSLVAFVRDNLGYYLLMAFCIPHRENIIPEQVISNSLLAEYLFEYSTWIEELFMYARRPHGGELEIALSETSEVFTKEDLKNFYTELIQIPLPDDSQLQGEYTNLCTITRLALESYDLTLVLSGG